MGCLFALLKWLQRAVSKLLKASGWVDCRLAQNLRDLVSPPETPSRPTFVVFGQSLLGLSFHIFQLFIHVVGLRSLLRTASIASMRDPFRQPGRLSSVESSSPSHAGVDAHSSSTARFLHCDDRHRPDYCNHVFVLLRAHARLHMSALARRSASQTAPMARVVGWLPLAPAMVGRLDVWSVALAPSSLGFIRGSFLPVRDHRHLSPLSRLLVLWRARDLHRGPSTFAVRSTTEIFFLSTF